MFNRRRRHDPDRPEVRPASLAPPAGSCAPAPLRPPGVTGPGERETVPRLDERDGWINGRADVDGRVVLHQFWTFGCRNCTNTVPHLRELWQRYAAHGLQIVAIHTPEFAHEADPASVAANVTRLGVTWPVLLDPQWINWHAFANRFWPRTIIADVAGRPWFDHAGEGSYDEMDDVIRHLLALHPARGAATYSDRSDSFRTVSTSGPIVEAARR